MKIKRILCFTSAAALLAFNGLSVHADSEAAVSPETVSAAESSSAQAEDENRDRENFHRSGAWGYTVLDDNTAAVSKYYGKDRHPVIPDTIEGYTVTAISGGWYLSGGKPVLYGNIHGLSYTDDGMVDDSQVYSPFSGNTKIEQVTVPDTVKQIGAIAFQGCTALTEVKLGSGVEFIGNNCFEGCTALEGIDIPVSCTYIDQKAFKDCTSLYSVSMPNLHMEHSVFTGCTSLGDFSLPEGMTDLPPYTFSGCTGLVSVNFPEGLVTIGDNAFSGCTSLKAIELPNTVTAIYNEAFMGCSSLTDAKLAKLDTLGSRAFADCGFTDLTVPDSLVRIGENAFGKTADGAEIKGFTLHCTEYSAAKSYAENNGIAVKTEEASAVEEDESTEDTAAIQIAPNSAPDKLFKIIIGVIAAVAAAVLIAIILIVVNHKTGKGKKEEDEYIDYDDDDYEFVKNSDLNFTNSESAETADEASDEKE